MPSPAHPPAIRSLQTLLRKAALNGAGSCSSSSGVSCQQALHVAKRGARGARRSARGPGLSRNRISWDAVMGGGSCWL